MSAASTLIRDLQSNGINLSVAGEKLKVDAPKGKLSPEFKEQLRLHKAQIISQLSSPKVLNLREKVNTLIARGISFSLSSNKFEIEGTDLLTVEDDAFLSAHHAGILCVLQQGLLVKEIFSVDPTLLEDYKVEILERELLVTDSAEKIPAAVHEAIITQVTKEWFMKKFEEYL